MINILYEDNHLLVAIKPINVPVQEDQSKDLSFLDMLIKSKVMVNAKRKASIKTPIRYNIFFINSLLVLILS